MECIIMTPLGDTVLDLSVDDIQELRARAIMKATPPGPSPVLTTPTTRTGAARLRTTSTRTRTRSRCTLKTPIDTAVS